MELGSREVCKAAVKMALSDTRAEETEMKAALLDNGIKAGAAHEALQQIVNKCVGLNLGGKIGIARYGSHISVCVFFAIGLLNLNDAAIGMGHRAV